MDIEMMMMMKGICYIQVESHVIRKYYNICGLYMLIKQAPLSTM